MEKSQAIIINHTSEPERICGSAARISTTEGTAAEIYARSTRENTADLIPRVIKLGHTSTIEHIYFSIAFENVSVFVEQFMIEFRLASFTVKSRRYVDFSKAGYYKPILRRSDGQAAGPALQEEFAQHIRELFAGYESFITKGIPKEDARFILPYAFRSNFYCTVNARELVHILGACLKGRGKNYPELVSLGNSLLDQACAIVPGIFKNFDHLARETSSSEEGLRELLGDIESGSVPEGDVCELIASTPQPHELVGIAALLRHKNMTPGQAARLVKDPALLNKLINIVISHDRPRELEQINFTFRLSNLTLASLTHLVRHRIQSINIPSFTEAGKSARCILPDSVKADQEALALYEKLVAHNNRLYEKLLSQGVLKEDLVYLYLAGNMVHVVTTLNGRELLHFMQLRTCCRAQWEIRLAAVEMLKRLREVSPQLYNYYGPSCYVQGKCPEGKMSCGKKEEICAYFKGIL